jgi:YHS domain-containing protein
MKRDPVCGIHIDPADALQLEYHGRKYSFCSHSCKAEFEDRPEEYAGPPSRTVMEKVFLDPLRNLATAIQEE